jgi:hypothetical protein
MGTDAHENFVKELRTKWTDLVRPEEKDKAPQILIDLVDTHIEQIEEILQARDAQSPETQARREVTRLNFDHSPEGELMRTYERRCHSTLLRGLEVLKKVRGKKKTERDEPPRYERRVPIPKDYARAGHRSTRMNNRCDGGEMNADVDLSWAHEDATPTAGDVGAGGSDEVRVGSGWRDPEIEASDVLACGGLVPEGCREGLGLGAEIDNPMGVVSEAIEPIKPAGVASATLPDRLADGAGGDDDQRAGPAAGGPCDNGLTEAAERADSQNVRNEAKFNENVKITQTEKSDDFIAKSGVDAGVDNFETKPNSGDELSREAASISTRGHPQIPNVDRSSRSDSDPLRDWPDTS